MKLWLGMILHIHKCVLFVHVLTREARPNRVTKACMATSKPKGTSKIYEAKFDLYLHNSVNVIRIKQIFNIETVGFYFINPIYILHEIKVKSFVMIYRSIHAIYRQCTCSHYNRPVRVRTKTVQREEELLQHVRNRCFSFFCIL